MFDLCFFASFLHVNLPYFSMFFKVSHKTNCPLFHARKCCFLRKMVLFLVCGHKFCRIFLCLSLQVNKNWFCSCASGTNFINILCCVVASGLFACFDKMISDLIAVSAYSAYSAYACVYACECSRGKYVCFMYM